MASHKYCSALLDDLNGKEVPIETGQKEVLSLMGVKAPSHPFLPFSTKNFLPKKPLTLGHCKSPLSAWVPRFQWYLLIMGLF